MPTKNLIRDSNSSELGTDKSKKKDGETEKPKGGIEVTHGNAPLLTVKYLELVLIELRKLTLHMENNG